MCMNVTKADKKTSSAANKVSENMVVNRFCEVGDMISTVGVCTMGVSVL